MGTQKPKRRQWSVASLSGYVTRSPIRRTGPDGSPIWRTGPDDARAPSAEQTGWARHTASARQGAQRLRGASVRDEAARLTYEVLLTDAGELAALTVLPDEGVAIPTGRTLPIAALSKVARDHVALTVQWPAWKRMAHEAVSHSAAGPAYQPVARGGARPTVAQIARAAERIPPGASLRRGLAQHFGVSPARADEYLRMARDAGALPTPTTGRPRNTTKLTTERTAK